MIGLFASAFCSSATFEAFWVDLLSQIQSLVLRNESGYPVEKRGL